MRRSLPLYLIAALTAALVFFSVRPVVPAIMASQRQAILASAQRHGIPADVLAAVYYNELFGQESHLLSIIIPGDSSLAGGVRDSLLGIHFLTLKQVQMGLKAVAALAGSNTTVGPAGLRVSVGREIQHETVVAGSRYTFAGMAERPSMIVDLMTPSTAIEYLAANLQRGMQRAAPGQSDDWTVSARWHNTGLTSDGPDVPRPLWAKGSRYIARVQEFRPEVRIILSIPATLPVQRALVPDPQDMALMASKASRAIHTTPYGAAP